MKYLLFNYGKTPDYIEYTFNTIKSVDLNSEIFFLSNKNNSFKNINNLAFEDFPVLKIVPIQKKNIHYFIHLF